MSIPISLILCTRNRAESLKNTLYSILSQKYREDLVHEIIAVDNNSSDNTRAVIEDFAGLSRCSVRYIFEPKTGLSFARNRGILESQGDIIVFTDDDIFADEDWLFSIYRCFKEYGPEVVCGKIRAVYPPNIPEWIRAHKSLLSGLIVNYDYGGSVIKFEERKMRPFIGANMAFRRTVFEKVGYFRTDLGAGTDVMGEDTEFAKRVIGRGIRNIYYAGDAVVSHNVDPERLRTGYIAKWFMMSGRYRVRVGMLDKNRMNLLSVPLRVYMDMIKGAFLMTASFYDKRRLVSGMELFFTGLGSMMESARVI